MESKLETSASGDRGPGWFSLLAVICLSVSFHVFAQESVPGEQPTVGEAGSRSSVGSVPASEWGEDFQVKVVGEPPVTRVIFSSFVGEVRNDLRNLLFKMRPGRPSQSSDWTIPIQVELWGSMKDVHKGDYLLTKILLRPDNRFVIKLAVKLHDGFQDEEFRLEVIRVLLIEHVLEPYRSDPGSFTRDEVKVPDWLVHGFDQLIEHRRSGSPSSFYRGFLASGQMLKPEEIFSLADAGKLDPVSLAVFRASSSAMVEALLSQADGDIGVKSLLADLGVANPPGIEVLLRQHFPAFREMDQGLDKWWALEVASLGQQQVLEFLNREETEHFLTDAVTVRIDGNQGEAEAAGNRRGLLDFLKPKKVASPAIPEGPFNASLGQYSLFLDHPEGNDELGDCLDRLQKLKRISHPLYRPVFPVYESIIGKLMKGQTRGIDVEIAGIEEMRSKIRDTLLHTEDYLNYYEATKAPQRSAEFDDYVKIRKSLERREAPGRKDYITRYLDSLEMEFR